MADQKNAAKGNQKSFVTAYAEGKLAEIDLRKDQFLWNKTTYESDLKLKQSEIDLKQKELDTKLQVETMKAKQEAKSKAVEVCIAQKMSVQETKEVLEMMGLL